MRFCLLSLLLLSSSLLTSDVRAFDEDAVKIIDGFVDPAACYGALEAADANVDRIVDAEEYVTFVQLLGEEQGAKNFLDDVDAFAELPLVLQSNFNILACLCQDDLKDDSCCVGNNAGLDTSGAYMGETPTPEEQTYLFLVCSLTGNSIDKVLSSVAPTPVPSYSPTEEPTKAPTEEPTAKPTPSPTQEGETRPPTERPTPTSDATEIIVEVKYDTGVQGEDPDQVYKVQLMDAMDSLAPEVLSEVRRQLRVGRKLSSVQLPTTLDQATLIDCPSGLSDDFFCETITAGVLLLFQPNEEDPEGVAETFENDMEDAIDDGGLQKKLDLLHPENQILILNSADLDPGGVVPGGDDEGIGGGGVAGVVVGSLAFVALLGLFVSRRQPPKETEQLEPAPRDLALEEAEADIEADKKKEATLGASKPHYDPGKDAMVDLDEDHAAQMSHDDSSNAGSSGWSSSAGVSSLNTGSQDGTLEVDHAVVSGGVGLSAISSSQNPALRTGAVESSPSMPGLSRTDLDQAIEAGDWAAVGATAALLAAASDSQSFSSQSHSKSKDISGASGTSRSGSSVSSLDAARAAELDHLVDAGDWEGVVLAAAKYEAGDSRAGDSRSSASAERSSESGSAAGRKTLDSSSLASSKAQKRQELRAVVEDLVRRVVPEEIQNVDEMMLQFRGREEELVETLRTMQERAVAQKARQGAQKAAKQQAKAAVATQRAEALLSPKSSSSSSEGDKIEGSFPASSSKSLGTGQVTTQATAKSLGTGQIEGPAKSKSLGTGTVQAPNSKQPSERERKQSALEMAIEAGDWEAVGEAAAMLSDHSSVASSADTDEINRMASADGHSSADGSDPEKRADELDELIEKGDWSGVAKAAAGYKKEDDPKKSPSKRKDDDARRQERLKKLQEEQDALAQAEVWMAIAEQSKQESQKPDQAASDAADWAIRRSLNAMVEAENQGRSSEGDASSTPKRKGKDDEEEEV